MGVRQGVNTTSAGKPWSVRSASGEPGPKPDSSHLALLTLSTPRRAEGEQAATWTGRPTNAWSQSFSTRATSLMCETSDRTVKKSLPAKGFQASRETDAMHRRSWWSIWEGLGQGTDRLLEPKGMDLQGRIPEEGESPVLGKTWRKRGLRRTVGKTVEDALTGTSDPTGTSCCLFWASPPGPALCLHLRLQLLSFSFVMQTLWILKIIYICPLLSNISSSSSKQFCEVGRLRSAAVSSSQTRKEAEDKDPLF